MTVSADDDVIVHFDAKAVRHLYYFLRHFDVCARRCRVASGVIVENAL